MKKMYKEITTKPLKSFGAEVLPDGTVKFDFWAPDASDVKLCIQVRDEEFIEIPMSLNDKGFYSLITNQAKDKTLYCYKINNELKVPDPASRYQPFDAHGLSQVIDSRRFDWGHDFHWKGKRWEESVFYELHVGTFTQEGTFKALKEKLDYLVSLGVTAIELMPVADFPGKRNWGYDGVLIYAPDSTYGTPDELKDLVKTAHEKGLMVFLDVVYNHFGCDGNYLYVYAKSQFFDHNKTTPWGDAINFKNKNVRDFFIENAIYWLNEYHFDGLRLDAVHAINDDSSPDIMEELSSRIKKSVNRPAHLVLENDDNAARYLDEDYSAQWNDDFHHCIHILTTGENSGYYEDYTPEKTNKPTSYYLARALSEGFAYQGEKSSYRNNTPRGEISSYLPPSKFLNFIQNHDQVGNRLFGERISLLSDKYSIRAAVCLYLLAPSIPMIFMGEEWGSKTSFCFFCDFNPELAEATKNGRKEEGLKFSQLSDSKVIETIPDPFLKSTFIKSKLNWDDLNKPEYQKIQEFYKFLLEIRQDNIVPIIQHIKYSDFEVINDKALLVNWHLDTDKNEKLTAIANFGQEPTQIDESFVEENFLAISNPEAKDLLMNQRMLMPKTVCWFLHYSQPRVMLEAAISANFEIASLDLGGLPLDDTKGI